MTEQLVATLIQTWYVLVLTTVSSKTTVLKTAVPESVWTTTTIHTIMDLKSLNIYLKEVILNKKGPKIFFRAPKAHSIASKKKQLRKIDKSRTKTEKLSSLECSMRSSWAILRKMIVWISLNSKGKSSFKKWIRFTRLLKLNLIKLKWTCLRTIQITKSKCQANSEISLRFMLKETKLSPAKKN